MRINKNYDIGKLAEELKEGINDSKKSPYNNIVKLDILTANNIMDVLKETQRREQKHQILESDLTFIKKEDGTQLNKMEITNSKKTKTNCNDCLMEADRLPECFGNYEEEDSWNDSCDDCKYKAMCEMIEEKNK